MLILRVRVFRRIVEPGNLEAAIAEVSGEANAFLATLSAIDVADVRIETAAADKYNGRVLYSITVIYVE